MSFFNKTFRIGNIIHLNACVGENGFQNHWKYGLGYDEAVNVMLKALNKGEMTVDAAVYPLVFCARHRIELFLKDQLLNFEEMRPKGEVTEKILNSIHDLWNLWEKFKEQGAKTDRRVAPFIKNAEPFICDFSEIDETGQTFRYPYDKENMLHLAKTPIINIKEFEKQYKKLSRLMEEFEYLSKTLIEEYHENIYTKHLSREDIHDISMALPPTCEWGKSDFASIKTALKDKYNIGSAELTGAINIIKSHRKFCTNIGMEIPLPQLSPASLQLFFELYSVCHGGNSCSIDVEIAHADKEALIKIIGSRLPKESMIALYTLLEMGKVAYSGESYDFLYKKYEEEDNCHPENFYIFIDRNRNALTYIDRALRSTGQIQLLKIMPTLNS